MGFSCCVFFGSIGGLIFAIPILATFLWLIRRADNKSKLVSMKAPNMDGNDKFYDEVARELQDKPLFSGLWTKAFAEMGGDDAKARALYIKYRVAQLAEASRQELEKSRVAKHQQERPKRVRKIKIIFAVAIIGATIGAVIYYVNAEQTPLNIRLKKLAEKGDANAANTLGLFYYSGEGVAKDYAEAFKWFSKSANQNNQDAQEMLGACYYYGYGIEKNYTEAVKWYRKSAEQGNREALYDLGYCYERGNGVQKDEVEAYKWYSIAVAHGMGNARENLATIESHITPEQISTAKQLSAAFVPRNQK